MSITSISNDTLGRDSFVNSQKPVPPSITGYTILGMDDTALDPAGGQTILINGNGFQQGATVSINGDTVAVVSYISSNQLSFTSTTKSAGTYAIYVVNADLGTAIFIPGLIYSELPTWDTNAGSLGSYYETTPISSAVVAGGDAPLTYALVSGSLPSGATLSAGGILTGTSPVDIGSTTYSFTIEAIDAQLQGSTRSFSLTINTDVVSWNNPASGVTVTLDGTEYTNVLAATSAAGYGVTYAADSLPAGLTLTNGTISGTPTTQATNTSVLTATANTTNRSATNTITWVVSLGDLFFPQTTLLLPGSVNTFVSDASTNNFAVSVFGDTRPNNFNPYLAGWSNQFDGVGDFISSPAITAAPGDFTLEGWINGNSTQPQSFSTAIFFSGNGTTSFDLWIQHNHSSNPGKVRFSVSTTVIVPSASQASNTWHHVAIVRSGSTATCYVNGEAIGSTTYTSPLGGAALSVGQNPGIASTAYAGYVSNVRFVNGTALYTANFTPPTSPLTAVAGTSLLTCQSNRFVDASTNAFAITRVGDVAVRSFSPFEEPATANGSSYFDGTGDYLSVPYSTNLLPASGVNFTAECWIYIVGATNGLTFILGMNSNAVNNWFIKNESGTLQGGIGNVQGNFGTAVAGTWVHLALVQNNNTMFGYTNGVQAFTSAIGSWSSNNLPVTVGARSTPDRNFTGHISSVRVVKGTAAYTANFTPPASPLTAVANTSLLTLQNNQPTNNSMFLDSSSNNMLVTRSGNTTQGSFSPYSPSGWSNFFDGNGDFLTAGSSTNLALGAADWTVEAWIYPTSVAIGQNIIVDWRNTNSGLPVLYLVNNQVWWRESSATKITSASTLNANTWYHVAVVKISTTTTMYINGVSVGSYTDTTNYANAELKIGKAWDSNHWNGYISNLRIVKGTAVYTSNFTPSTQPLTAISGTSLLTCQSATFVDNSPNRFALTRSGDTRVTNFAPFKAVTQTPVSYSGYFDGSGDRLTSPNNFELATNGNWTIEAFLNPSSVSTSTRYILGLGKDTGGTTPYLQISTNSSGMLIVDESSTTTRQWFFDTTQVLPVGVFSHIALVQDGSAIRLYYNGVVIGSTTFSTAHQTAMRPWIGEILFSSGAARTDGFIGYISNVRYVNGVSVYSGTSTTTANFTPPTQPLEAIEGTSLLTCQSPQFVDNSTNNFAITATGNAQPTTINPFGVTFANSGGYTAAEHSGSMYFDGTGDTVSVASDNILNFGTGDFTVEFWIYLTASSTTTPFNILNGGSTGSFCIFMSSSKVEIARFAQATDLSYNQGPPLNAWTHWAFTRQSNTGRIFLNGAQVATGAINTSYFGASFNFQPTSAAYLSDLRIAKGTARYTSSFVPPQAPLEPVPNTVLLLSGTGAGIVDATSKNVLETVGDAQISTAVSKFGGSSMRFDGSGDWIQVSGTNPHLAFGTGAFTVEFWFYSLVASGTQQLFDTRPAGTASTTGYMALTYSGNLNYFTAGGNPIAGGAVSANAWHHVALARSGTSTRLFVDGVQVGSTYTDTQNYLNGLNRPIIGADGNSPSASLTGYVQDLRITREHARYTSNFTLPTTAFNTK